RVVGVGPVDLDDRRFGTPGGAAVDAGAAGIGVLQRLRAAARPVRCPAAAGGVRAAGHARHSAVAGPDAARRDQPGLGAHRPRRDRRGAVRADIDDAAAQYGGCPLTTGASGFAGVAQDYPAVETEHWLVDAMAARFVLKPETLDVAALADQ